ncbi:MAG: hypothetical protein ACM30G_10195 [Micromonosporaceae bacterium]
MGARRQWRVEGDDDWLAEHRGDTFVRLRRRLPGHAGRVFADSVLGGTVFSPRRNPQLRLDSRYTEQIRYAERQYAYTAVTVELQHCRVCGGRRLVRHRIALVAADGRRTHVGQLAGCFRCHSESWLFRSRMPSVVAYRVRNDKVVL